MRPTLSMALLCWLIIVVSGCNAPPPLQPVAESKLATASKSATSKDTADADLPLPVMKGREVTQGKYFDASKEIEAAVLKGVIPFSEKIDYLAMMDIALEGVELDDMRRDLTISYFVKSGVLEGLMVSIVNNAAQGGSYRLVRLHKEGERYRALFRLVEPQGLNYHVLELGEDADGNIAVKDFFMTMAGEPFSATIRQLILPLLKDEPAVARILANPDHPDNLDYNEVRPLIDAAGTGEFAKGLELYREMSARTRKTKMATTLQLQCALGLGDAVEFEQASNGYRAQFPQDVGADLCGLVFYLEHKDAMAARHAIGRIDRYVGGDLYLNVIRGRVAATEGEYAKAEKLMLQAAEASDALPDCYLALVDVSLKQEQFDKTLKYFVEMERRFQLKMNDLSTLPEYAPFVASPQYQQWLKRKDNEQE